MGSRGHAEIVLGTLENSLGTATEHLVVRFALGPMPLGRVFRSTHHLIGVNLLTRKSPNTDHVDGVVLSHATLRVLVVRIVTLVQTFMGTVLRAGAEVGADETFLG